MMFCKKGKCLNFVVCFAVDPVANGGGGAGGPGGPAGAGGGTGMLVSFSSSQSESTKDIFYY